MGLKAKSPSLIQFYSIISKYDVITIQMCTLNITTSAIIPKELWSWDVHFVKKEKKTKASRNRKHAGFSPAGYPPKY